MIKRALPLLALAAALGLTGTAAAEKIDLKGPLAIAGRGFVRGEVQLGSEQGSAAPMRFRARSGFIRFVDLGGDLEVRCQGRGRHAERKDADGHTVVTCMGARGRAAAAGSHFRFVAFAARYQALFPKGATGTVQGQFRSCAPGGDGQAAAPDAQPSPEGRQGEKRGQRRDRQHRNRRRTQGLAKGCGHGQAQDQQADDPGADTTDPADADVNDDGDVDESDVEAIIAEAGA